MRCEKGHKDTTRKHVVEVASKHFRKNGIEGASIKDLMGGAGLTHGGFYSHFDSKQQLLQQALTQAFTETRSALSKVGESDGIEGVIRQYLGQSHRDEAERLRLCRADSGNCASGQRNTHNPRGRTRGLYRRHRPSHQRN
jgi:TetR/AcrR family transcriptional regulator, transcriptional repressor for nem operon